MPDIERTYVVRFDDLREDKPGRPLLSTHLRVVMLADAERLRQAANAVSEAWDAWMESEDDTGMDEVVDAIGDLRAAIRNHA